MQKRQTRAVSQEQTRQKLVASAEREFAFLGYEGAAVDTICAKAGFSRGAFYSNFKSKEDLFLCLVGQKMEEVLGELAAFSQSASVDPGSLMAFMGRYYAKRAQDPTFTLLMAEFLRVGIRNPRLRQAIAVINRRYIAAVAKGIKTDRGALGQELGPSAEQIAALLLSAGLGIMLYHFADPKGVDAEYTVTALQHLLGRLLPP